MKQSDYHQYLIQEEEARKSHDVQIHNELTKKNPKAIRHRRGQLKRNAKGKFVKRSENG